ncbi:MAG: NAD(P)-dependent alcohol dehydrogenase [Streptosporangiaceae bacterium]|jgi:NADPH:quinone reductase-like Zn-dependent oxidoreductase
MNTTTMTTRLRTTDGTTMRAITQDRYGEAGDVLRLEEIGRPAIGDEEVLLRVHAAGVDRGVWHLMTGLPYPVRLAGYGIRAPKTPVRGREVAGRVEATGSAVTTLHVGDEVFGIADGVGTFAVQIAKAAGAEVTGVCRTAKMDTVRSLGADHVIDYTRADIAAGGRRYDVIIDIGGNRALKHLRSVLDPRGTLVIVGGETGGRWLAGSDRQLRALLLSPFTGQTLTTLICSENTPDLLALTELIESGQVRPVIDRTFPLSQTPEAIQYMRDGHARGKVVISL